ncbi:MAG TPA: inorganic pyrophosphatase, partial [Leucothrix sp.]|nr:inorganic pyrophosphatase [Leucothrix sp.]
AYIEITPYDSVKYESDKKTGYLMVDRPQRASSAQPSLYGFIPRTYCGERTASLMGVEGLKGDKDPLDICVFSERPITRADILLHARVLGGLPMIDDGEADDKIIAVLATDNIWGQARDIDDLPQVLIERLDHYFKTYKMLPGKECEVKISDAYGREHAQKVVKASIEDYQERYGE